jgi:DNA polymerase V
MAAFDAVNERFGRQTLTVASAARRERADGHVTHASRQERRSPRYTTRLDEIARAHAR